MINCCDEISDPTPIHVASRMAQDHDPIEAGSFVESDRVEKSWADEKLMIRSLFHSDRIVSGIGPWLSENADLSLLQIHSGKAYEGTCRIPRQNGDGRGRRLGKKNDSYSVCRCLCMKCLIWEDTWGH